MTDCFQPCELHYRTTYQTIQEMNLCRVSYLIVTKSALPAAPEYLEILDKELAHIQITVTCLDDTQTAQFEKASPPSQRIRAIQALQAEGYDVAIRLSPIVEEYMDFDKPNDLGIERCVVEFLRVNSWIRQWFRGVDFSKYTVRQGGYGLSNAVTRHSQDVKDYDRATALEGIGYNILSMPARQWSRINQMAA